MYFGDSHSDWQREQSEKRLLEDILETCRHHYRFYAGIDLAKQQDKSVIAIIESRIDTDTDKRENVLKRLQPLPQKMDYTAQADLIFDTFQADCFQLWPTEIFIDASGVGEVVCELLDEMGLKFRKVQIVSGDTIKAKGGKLRVARSVLFQSVRSHFMKQDIKISGDLPTLQDLRNETLAVSENFGGNGNVFYQSGSFDDHIVSYALAALALDRRHSIRTGVTSLY